MSSIKQKMVLSYKNTASISQVMQKNWKQAAPVAVEAGRRFVKVGQDLVLPSAVGVYFKGDTGYERKGTYGGLAGYPS